MVVVSTRSTCMRGYLYSTEQDCLPPSPPCHSSHAQSVANLQTRSTDPRYTQHNRPGAILPWIQFNAVPNIIDHNTLERFGKNH